MNYDHPDVAILHNYDGTDLMRLWLVPIATPTFPYGLELAETFTEKAKATERAIQVQAWLNRLRQGTT